MISWVADLPVDFTPLLPAGLVDFLTAGFVAGFAGVAFTAFAARSRGRRHGVFKIRDHCGIFPFTRVRSSTRICNSSFALFAALS